MWSDCFLCVPFILSLNESCIHILRALVISSENKDLRAPIIFVWGRSAIMLPFRWNVFGSTLLIYDRFYRCKSGRWFWVVGAVEILHRGNKVYTPVQSIHNVFALLEKIRGSLWWIWAEEKWEIRGICLFSWCDLAIWPRRHLGPMNLDRSQNLTVADPELQIRGGWGGPAHSDPEIGWVGGGGSLNLVSLV